MSDESSVSQSAVAPPTSPTSSAAPISISSPDEVMEQLLHHQLEELESSHRHDDVTQDDTEDITIHICSHSLNSVDVSIPAGTVRGDKEQCTPADSVKVDKEQEEVGGNNEPAKTEETESTPPLEGEHQPAAFFGAA